MKRCSTLFILKEIQTKITIEYDAPHPHQTRNPHINTDVTAGMGVKPTLHALLGTDLSEGTLGHSHPKVIHASFLISLCYVLGSTPQR